MLIILFLPWADTAKLTLNNCLSVYFVLESTFKNTIGEWTMALRSKREEKRLTHFSELYMLTRVAQSSVVLLTFPVNAEGKELWCNWPR